MSTDKEQRENDPSAHEQMMDAEKHVQRNPHGNFKEVEAGRPEWNTHEKWAFTKTKQPDWQPGGGANDGGECLKKEHVSAAALMGTAG